MCPFVNIYMHLNKLSFIKRPLNVTCIDGAFTLWEKNHVFCNGRQGIGREDRGSN